MEDKSVTMHVCSFRINIIWHWSLFRGMFRISLGWLSHKKCMAYQSPRLFAAKLLHHKPFNFTLLQNLQEVHNAVYQAP